MRCCQKGFLQKHVGDGNDNVLEEAYTVKCHIRHNKGVWYGKADYCKQIMGKDARFEVFTVVKMEAARSSEMLVHYAVSWPIRSQLVCTKIFADSGNEWLCFGNDVDSGVLSTFQEMSYPLSYTDCVFIKHVLWSLNKILMVVLSHFLLKVFQTHMKLTWIWICYIFVKCV